MPVGQLEYHLRAMEGGGLLKAADDRYYKRYYAAGVDAGDKELLAVLRQENPRKIVLHIMLNPGVGHGELAAGVSMAPSTLSFYLGDMAAKGVLLKVRDGRTTQYSIADPEKVSRILVTYRRGFLDKLVDRFISVWFAKEAPRGEGARTKPGEEPRNVDAAAQDGRSP